MALLSRFSPKADSGGGGLTLSRKGAGSNRLLLLHGRACLTERLGAHSSEKGNRFTAVSGLPRDGYHAVGCVVIQLGFFFSLSFSLLLVLSGRATGRLETPPCS